MKTIQIRPAFETKSEIIGFLVFCLLLFAMPFALPLFKIDRNFLFQYPLTENADLRFLRSQLYVQKEDIDWAFVGPCTTWWHIHPEIVAHEISKKQPQLPPPRILNLGFNHASPEFTYLLLRELVKNRRVKNVVLSTPRWNDSDQFPHPDSHYWWLYGEDLDLLKGLSWREHFRLYSATTMGSLRHLSLLVFRPPPRADGPRLTDETGARLREGTKSVEFRALPAADSEFIYDADKLASLPLTLPALSATQRHLAREISQFLKSQGVRLWLLSSPLESDFASEEIRERENWPSLTSDSVKLIGIAPRHIRQIYSESEIADFFTGDNFSLGGSRVFSHWVGQILRSQHAD